MQLRIIIDPLTQLEIVEMYLRKNVEEVIAYRVSEDIPFGSPPEYIPPPLSLAGKTAELKIAKDAESTVVDTLVSPTNIVLSDTYPNCYITLPTTLMDNWTFDEAIGDLKIRDGSRVIQHQRFKFNRVRTI
jgi:hypothetical protein